MLGSIKEKVASFFSKSGKAEEKVPFSPVTMTVALCKRKREEEEFAKYGVTKERTFLLEVIDE